MKKLIIFVILLLAVMTIWSDEVKLNDGRCFTGTIAGKQGDYLFIYANEQTYQIAKSEISSIIRNGGLVTKLTFDKKDFMDSEQGNAILIENQTPSLEGLKSADLSKGINKDILMNMSEREFEIYKLQQQQKQLEELTKATKGISGSMWGITGMTIAMGVIGVLIAGE